MITSSINISINDQSPGKNLVSGSSKVSNSYKDFEQQYLSLRKKENRIYTDAELLKLPDIRKDHPHYKEWLIRKNSFQKLSGYLNQKKKSLDILEIGCGNGWLCNQLSVHLNCQVTGLDINSAELDQAARVFKQNAECVFLHGDPIAALPGNKKFDITIFAASLQYFSPAKDILNIALGLLKTGGEIHILDTPLYKELELEEARQRSKSYFTSLGFAGMTAMYFHHSLNELTYFHPLILHDPSSFKNRFFRNQSPFHWICIKKD